MNSEVPSRPKIVNLESINCGRAIKVEWGPSSEITITGYHVLLKPALMDYPLQFERRFNVSSDVRSKEIKVESNTDYDVYIRASNSAGVGLWTKQLLKTTAGTN